MNVLVAYGSRRGGTKGLATWVAEDLRTQGLEVDVLPARQAGRLAGYDAVVVGGALYMARWHRDARRFVRRHAAELRRRPTYFFSSGPLDATAAGGDLPPVKGVAALMERVGAAGHVTFGGRLAPDAKGIPAAAMAKKMAGDWRDVTQVREWARGVAADIQARLGAADGSGEQVAS